MNTVGWCPVFNMFYTATKDDCESEINILICCWLLYIAYFTSITVSGSEFENLFLNYASRWTNSFWTLTWYILWHFSNTPAQNIYEIHIQVNVQIAPNLDQVCKGSSIISGVDLGGIPLSRAPQIFRRNTRFAGTVIRPDYQLLLRFGDPILGLTSLDWPVPTCLKL